MYMTEVLANMYRQSVNASIFFVYKHVKYCRYVNIIHIL